MMVKQCGPEELQQSGYRWGVQWWDEVKGWVNERLLTKDVGFCAVRALIRHQLNGGPGG